MIVAIHQPQYLPWLGYFDKIDRSDVFIFLDNVQFKKNEWQNRNKIKTSEDWQWLSVPVIHRFTQKIYEVEINNTVQWGRKHLNALVTNYSKAPFFKEYIGFFEQAYAQDWNNLVDINIHIIKYLTMVLGILDKKLVLASELDTREEPTERLIDICRQERGDVYFSGKDGAKYMNTEKFKEEGIRIIFQDYKHPQYTQLYGSFEPYLSIIDLLFNCGPKSLSVLRKGE
ncbi:MAG: WbqC family protein [Candidatus Aminicenantes bacterium]|nr:WbqC family protein [Candidatus Aminicenantes bacterium]